MTYALKRRRCSFEMHNIKIDYKLYHPEEGVSNCSRETRRSSDSLVDFLFRVLGYFLGDYVTQLLQLLHDLGILAQVLHPLVVRQLLPSAAISLRQVARGYVFMEAAHVAAVEEDSVLHPDVQQRLEHREYHVEHPGLVQDVNSVGFHGKCCHHQR